MKDSNYLGHSFYINYNGSSGNMKYLAFKCSVCNINSYYYITQNLFTTDEESHAELIPLVEDGLSFSYKKLIMSCAEIQIKNLLE